MGKPILGNPTQINKEEIRKERIKTDLSNPDPIHHSNTEEKMSSDSQQRLSFEELVKKTKEQIDYEELIDRNDKDEIDDILSIIVEVMSTKCDHFTISGKQYPAELVYQRYSQINISIIEYVLECMHKCGSNIRNIKQYLVAALFNAPATCESYYGAAVRRDLEFMRR